MNIEERLNLLGYGTSSLITSHGKILCIVYTIIGLTFALFLQQILHRKIVTYVYRTIYQLAIHRSMIYYFTKHRSYSLAFSLVILSIILFIIIIPTLLLHRIYAPKWSLIELTYFLVTTNHLIGFGDYMPCGDLSGSNRSRCAMIMAGKYVIIRRQLLISVLLSLCPHSSINCEYTYSYVLYISAKKT